MGWSDKNACLETWTAVFYLNSLYGRRIDRAMKTMKEESEPEERHEGKRVTTANSDSGV